MHFGLWYLGQFSVSSTQYSVLISVQAAWFSASRTSNHLKCGVLPLGRQKTDCSFLHWVIFGSSQMREWKWPELPAKAWEEVVVSLMALHPRIFWVSRDLECWPGPYLWFPFPAPELSPGLQHQLCPFCVLNMVWKQKSLRVSVSDDGNFSTDA